MSFEKFHIYLHDLVYRDYDICKGIKNHGQPLTLSRFCVQVINKWYYLPGTEPKDENEYVKFKMPMPVPQRFIRFIMHESLFCRENEDYKAISNVKTTPYDEVVEIEMHVALNTMLDLSRTDFENITLATDFREVVQNSHNVYCSFCYTGVMARKNIWPYQKWHIELFDGEDCRLHCMVYKCKCIFRYWEDTYSRLFDNMDLFCDHCYNPLYKIRAKLPNDKEISEIEFLANRSKAEYRNLYLRRRLSFN